MNTIQIEIVVNAPVEKVWEYWTSPEHIVVWNHASDDWHCPKAENDLREGGHFSSIMSSVDGSSNFDFNGTYSHIEPLKEINYALEDGREVQIIFERVNENSTRVTEIFEAETENSEELQKSGWHAILENFKKHVEND